MKFILFNFIILGLLNITNCYNQRYNPYKKTVLKPRSDHYSGEEISHLDSKNIKNLEKIFYLKNNKYSPFKKIIHMKYQSNNLNVTEILTDINNQINENYDRDQKLYNEEQQNMTRMFEEAFNGTNNIYTKIIYNSLKNVS